MNLEPCFVCRLPVLELDGQFASFAPYHLGADDEAARERAFGHCHLSCLIGSKWGTFWAARRIEQMKGQGLKAIERGGITIFDNPAAGERLAIRSDGMTWSYPIAKSKRRTIEGGALVLLDEEWNLELDGAELVARIRRDLEKEKRSPLLAIADALSIRDRLIAPDENAQLVYDRELARLWRGNWISARARYEKFVPTEAL